MLKVAWVIGFSAVGYEVAERVYPSKGYYGVAAGALVGAVAGYLTMGVLPEGAQVGPAGGNIKPPQPSAAVPTPGTTDPWGNPWGTTKVSLPPAVQNPILPAVPDAPIFVTPPKTDSAGLVPYSAAGSVLPMEGANEVIQNTGTYGNGINQAFGDSWISNRFGLRIKNNALTSEGYYINLAGYYVNFYTQENFYFGNAPQNPNSYAY
jgi:hypothetical protein